MDGHLSLSSLIPSLSESGTGQPLYFAEPATVGHLSSSSFTPSLSESGTGQPSYLATPGVFGHLSTLSLIPSPSVSSNIGTSGVVTATVFCLPPNNRKFSVACTPLLCAFVTFDDTSLGFDGVELLFIRFLNPCIYLTVRATGLSGII